MKAVPANDKDLPFDFSDLPHSRFCYVSKTSLVDIVEVMCSTRLCHIDRFQVAVLNEISVAMQHTTWR